MVQLQGHTVTGPYSFYSALALDLFIVFRNQGAQDVHRSVAQFFSVAVEDFVKLVPWWKIHV